MSEDRKFWELANWQSATGIASLGIASGLIAMGFGASEFLHRLSNAETLSKAADASTKEHGGRLTDIETRLTKNEATAASVEQRDDRLAALETRMGLAEEELKAVHQSIAGIVKTLDGIQKNSAAELAIQQQLLGVLDDQTSRSRALESEVAELSSSIEATKILSSSKIVDIYVDGSSVTSSDDQPSAASLSSTSKVPATCVSLSDKAVGATFALETGAACFNKNQDWVLVRYGYTHDDQRFLEEISTHQRCFVDEVCAFLSSDEKYYVLRSVTITAAGRFGCLEARRQTAA